MYQLTNGEESVLPMIPVNLAAIQSGFCEHLGFLESDEKDGGIVIPLVVHCGGNSEHQIAMLQLFARILNLDTVKPVVEAVYAPFERELFVDLRTALSALGVSLVNYVYCF